MSNPAKSRVRQVAASLLARFMRLVRAIIRAISWLVTRLRHPNQLRHEAVSTVRSVPMRTVKWLVINSIVLSVGSTLVVNGVVSITRQSPQVSYYNQAMANYRANVSIQNYFALDQADALFQKSIAAYQSQTHESRLQRLLYGSPSTELAALAYFHEGLSELYEGQATATPQYSDNGVYDLEEAIALDPGVPYAAGMTSGNVNKLEEEALTYKYDLELLYQQDPQEEQEQKTGGKKPGSPKPGGKHAAPQPQQAPNQNPMNVSGHGSSDGI